MTIDLIYISNEIKNFGCFWLRFDFQMREKGNQQRRVIFLAESGLHYDYGTRLESISIDPCNSSLVQLYMDFFI